MKTTRLHLLGGIITIIGFASCQKNLDNLNPGSPNTVVQADANIKGTSQPPSTGPCPYTISLTPPVQVNGNWIWVWTIVNNKFGNGKNGTVQNLSHWSMSPATCFNLSSVVSAAYSSNGTNWTSFTPTIGADPSSCVNTPVLKFDYGTNGSNVSHYRLVLNQYYPVGNATGYYKSGVNTGCGQFTFPGIACYTIYSGD